MSEYSEIYLAGGCFWGVQKYLASIKGVISTEAGYANGKTLNPTYEEVCRNNTGHAETVQVVYNDEYISLDELLNVYFRAIDPTSLNRQGGDVGTQYRTGIYYVNNADRPIIDSAIAKLAEQHDKPIAIEVKPSRTIALQRSIIRTISIRILAVIATSVSTFFKTLTNKKPSGCLQNSRHSV